MSWWSQRRRLVPGSVRTVSAVYWCRTVDITHTDVITTVVVWTVGVEISDSGG